MENQYDRIPEHLKPRNSGTDELFKNRFMERFTRTHILIPITMHFIIVGRASYLALQQHSMLTFTLLFVAGWLLWTFSEYWIHRYVYHVKTDKKWLLRLQHAGHGIHHQYPKDPTRLAMPPLPALILLSIFYGVFWSFMRSYTIAFFPGFVFGYLTYISLHYAEHRFKPPKFAPLNKLWKYHLLHHYRFSEDKAFGVSTLLWDRVFRTLPEEKKVNS
jgi:sterol desaturase/sphingolipid hydroxylase (fatty acid hydroxylase superfamily)